MKVDSIIKFRIMAYLREQFDIKNLNILFISEDTAKATDKVGDSIYFKYEDGKIRYYDKL
ncbi:hypothetical protein [Clostridium amazonitimonense]|uniref:hypothetical protein n=1 Tax=Clostridium amazonitimonense TaxID=1499689 RepID=UPI000509AF06|nr:hypothetical protein [Clostridium amazonitimonense]